MGIRVFAVAGSLVIVAAMGIALGIYFRVIPVPMALLGMLAVTAQPEFSARYYPEDTLAYAWASLTPRGRQKRYTREIWRRFNEHPGFTGTVNGWKSGLDEETGINFDQDVATWIGPEISAGLLDLDAETQRLSAAVLIGVRDADAAADFLERWLDYVATKRSVEFSAGVYRDNPIWVSNLDGQSYALMDDWLVYATDEDALHAIVERIEKSAD